MTDRNLTAVALTAQQMTEYVQMLTGHQRQLFLYIITLLNDAAEAEEVLQNTNLALWTRAAEYRWGQPFAAWAYHLAHWEVLSFRRRRGRDRLQFSSELMETIAAEFDPNDETHLAMRQRLSGCLDKLGTEDRDLVARRYLPGATTREVADSLQRPVKSIYRSLERIRIALLHCLQRSSAQENEP